MTAENENFENRAPGSPSRRLPLFIGVGALLLYAITLNHWVSISSLANVARITGWDWHPGWLDWRATPFSPLWLLASAPARLLPEAAQPPFGAEAIRFHTNTRGSVVILPMGASDQVYGLGGGVDQMSSKPAHRFNHDSHTQTAGVIGQRMEVLRRPRQLLRWRRATAHMAGMAVMRAAIGRSPKLRGLLDGFLVPCQSEPALLRVICREVAVLGPVVARADGQLDA